MIRVMSLKKDTPVKSGFKTLSQANAWARKNLPANEVHFWGRPAPRDYKYYVQWT